MRKLGLVDVLAIGVNAIVGSGVFAMPDDMQRAMGTWSPFAYLLCAIVLIPVSLCFAELAGSEDKNGGPYLYATRAFGRRVGFVMGWSCYLNAFLSFAANATLLGALLKLDHHILYRPAVVAIILGLGAINYVGVRPGANLVHVMTVGKLLAIVLFIVAALTQFSASRFGGALPNGASGVATGIYLALFPLQGFETVPVPAGETKNPERNVPIATVASLLFASLLFVLVQAVIVASYHRALTAQNQVALGNVAQTPLVDAATRIAPVLGVLVLIGSLVSVGGFIAGSALGSPRYAQALAVGGDLPKRLSELHPRYGTPHIAIAATTVVAALLGAFFDYRKLVGFSNVTVVLQYALTCAAVPVLRKKSPERKGGFRVPGGAFLPVFGVIGSVALLSGSSLEEVIWAASGIAAGVVIAVGTKAYTARAAA